MNLLQMILDYYILQYPYLFFDSNETNYIVAV